MRYSEPVPSTASLTGHQATSSVTDESVNTDVHLEMLIDFTPKLDTPNVLTVPDKIVNVGMKVPDHVDKYDIGLYVNRSLNDHEKLNILKNIWKPDQYFSFKTNIITKRRFNHKWLDMYPWLRYSKFVNGVFCVYCVLFASNAGKLQQLCKTPFTDWKNALTVFQKHSTKSPQHKRCHSDATELQKVFENKVAGVNVLLDRRMHHNVAKNREVIKSLLKILIMMAQQCMLLRGRDESDPSSHFQDTAVATKQASIQNPGNFLALIRL